MYHVSAAAFTETNPDLSKALFNATSTIDAAKLAENEVLIAALGVPVNPSDRLQVAGSYKTPINFQHLGQDSTEKKVAVGGNEGCFCVVAVGQDVSSYKVGDWVILKLTSFGTWRSHAIVPLTPDNPDPLIVVLSDGENNISMDEASTISTNPCTAYQLFHNYVSDWQENDWIVMNAGNSFVNKYLYQLAKHHGVKTLGIVRRKPDFAEVAKELRGLGATEIVAEDKFLAEDFVSATLPKLVGETARVRLALDSVAGPTTPNLVAALSNDQTFVNYGGMSGGMVQYSPGVQLAKNITLKSYWLTRNTRQNPQLKVDTIRSLLPLYKSGVFQPVKFTHIPWDGTGSLRDAFVQAIDESHLGKRVVTFPGNVV
ncbi:putative trans-2-enoyl-CoA reductase [Metschnikowia bicuspidata var. bicuspidata NRRL YB-4993]|uniref:enoyl-[acyl-carrier-protein] reductase n=1 Tax=Metschnikowia bicuspidata var. bicuspidata NRRL YB-4993 TaxID=869754 RepID=A0A1A0H895_9ASCO|nr:putative trans-2-enoyl-CoA reductase [Metschnikowia bicuspidata var. bicuspidata NRRL YB-4993]OBA20334.1 putative trans-2-enoyl-CoA reductase [Metschnikowia bicuspidata var. bicuspidata NRRL YB-4993]